MNSPTLGPADVVLSGALNVHNAKLRNVKLHFLGGSPNATVKLYTWDAGKFTEYDTLTVATITESPSNPDRLTVVGVSAMAKEDAVGFSDADCTATWDITVTGRCDDCG